LLLGGAAGLLLGGTGCGLGGEPLGEQPLTLDDLGRKIGVERLEAGRLGQTPLELGLDGGDELGLAVPCLLHGHEPRRHLLAHRRRMARGAAVTSRASSRSTFSRASWVATASWRSTSRSTRNEPLAASPTLLARTSAPIFSATPGSPM
jgi:hypothetical protein